MTSDEFNKYWKPVRDSGLFGPALYSWETKRGPLVRARELRIFLGMNPDMSTMEQKLTDELKSKLIALVGPHGATIKRMMEIRNGLVTEIGLPPYDKASVE